VAVLAGAGRAVVVVAAAGVVDGVVAVVRAALA
jgi:hypothetical protein